MIALAGLNFLTLAALAYICLWGFHVPQPKFLGPPTHTTSITFSGNPIFDSDGAGSMPPKNPHAPWPENRTFFGEHGDAVDHTWHELAFPFAFEVSEEEATLLWGEDKYKQYLDPPTQTYRAGLDVFHSLHCIDWIRRALDLEYYPFTPDHGPEHLLHCLENIRQTVQCHGSTVVVPIKYQPGLGHGYVDLDAVTHSCRDIRALREWVDDRVKASNF
ncbi:hypothetical protein GQ53DRAFT_821074 [Thozetella sp. PMI_491]|nr:hypothetical protein GQ53DRAFT_821074 [Thozetella sp. PMI_491]